ncbi:reverse transcriptase domain-containing protein [Tanacetum coccineum]
MQEVMKKEMVKLLDTGWRVCIDYRKLNEATAKDHFPLPKKCGTIVVTNERDELVPTRTVTGWRKGGITVVTNERDDLVPTRTVRGWRINCFNVAKMHILSLTGKMSLHGKRRNYDWTQGIYKRFIKDFSKISRPLTKLLEKDTPLEFNNECHNAFKLLKEKLTCAPVIVSPNWNLLFELMCGASDFAVETILGQKDGKNFHQIYFASKTLNAAQQNYTITEKELMAVVFAFDKF